MNENEISELEANIETTIAAAHAVFASQNSNVVCELLVNSQATVDFVDGYFDFGRRFDNYEVTLSASMGIYSKIAPNLEDIREEICRVLNDVHQVNGESVSRVRIKIDQQSISDWRKQTGLLHDGQMNYTQAEAGALWGQGLRMFISHASKQKGNASELGDLLENEGMSVFIAHEDIHPTWEWQREIEKALSTMDAFVALLTEEFKLSDWCSQELGFAVARPVPIFPVKMGADPYGFIGKFQALSADIHEVKRVIKHQFVDHPKMPATKLSKFSKFTNDIKSSRNFEESNGLSHRLPEFDVVSVEQADKLAETINGNDQVRDSWGFNRKRESNGNLNIAEHLTRMTGIEYVLNEDRDTRHEWLVRRTELSETTTSREQTPEDDEDDLEDLPW